MSFQTDWEARYKEMNTPWDKGGPSPGLVHFLAATPLHGRVLVPGCGYGHDVRSIAEAGGASVEVLGIDIAPSAVRGAQAVSACEDACNFRYEVADLFALPTPYLGTFDWVWEHTCFCAIDPALREKYAASVAKALKPGGHFLAVHYMNPWDEEEIQAAEGKTLGPPFGCTTDELNALFTPYFDLLRDWVPCHTYPGREGREQMRLYVRKPSAA